MRLDRNIKQKVHDPYDDRRKYPEGTYCPECGALYQGGRWKWPEKKEVTGQPCLCCACRRIRDRFSAGEVYLSGRYLHVHRSEILNLVGNIIRQEEVRSPLKRVIDFTEDAREVCVRLTDNHLARHIGEAVYRAYSGELEVKYSEEEKFVRLYWCRDA
ncbi:MAG TPA: ATPase [Deltaproteobacteria bacterium]|nr:ATPase [Deltaproteobacteria bacterium]